MNSSHPSTPQRVVLAGRHARRIGPPGTGDHNRQRYLQGIEGLLFGDAGKDGTVRGNKFYHKRLGIAFEAPNGFEIINRDDAVIVSGPNQMALRFDAVSTEGEPKGPSAYLRSGWVNGLREETVSDHKISRLNASSGEAEAGDWKFSISVVEFDKRFYRFILAAPRSSGDVKSVERKISNSFHAMTKAEKAGLKPLRIRVVKVKPGDTIGSLTGKMRDVARKDELFKALNGLGEGDRLKPGTLVKIVSY